MDHRTIDKLKMALSRDGSIIFAYLFGSHAGDQPTPHSDVDIAVYLQGRPDGNTRLDILGAMIDTLKTDHVDLVILNTAPLPLKIRVIRNSILLVDKLPFIRQTFESSTISEYIDFSRYESHILKQRFSF